jgi:hypothetical protein
MSSNEINKVSSDKININDSSADNADALCSNNIVAATSDEISKVSSNKININTISADNADTLCSNNIVAATSDEISKVSSNKININTISADNADTLSSNDIVATSSDEIVVKSSTNIPTMSHSHNIAMPSDSISALSPSNMIASPNDTTTAHASEATTFSAKRKQASPDAQGESQRPLKKGRAVTDFEFIRDTFGYTFQDLNLLHEALDTTGLYRPQSNQSLALIGDSILQLTIYRDWYPSRQL